MNIARCVVSESAPGIARIATICFITFISQILVCCSEDNQDTEPAVEGEQLSLPLPTGPYLVGLSERVMTTGGGVPSDEESPVTPYPFGSNFYMRVFYPVDSAYSGETLEINPRFFDCSKKELVLTHTYPHADIVPGTDRFPVVVFAPGLGTSINMYLSILEDLASHGYIVAAFQPEQTIPDDLDAMLVFSPPEICASQEEWEAYIETETSFTEEIFDFFTSNVPLWLSNAIYVLDQLELLDRQDPSGIFTGRFDLKKVGMFGHSFGGATAREACVTDPRFLACENLDGAFYGEHFDTPVERPLMIQLTEDHNNGMVFLPRVGYVEQIDQTQQPVWEQSAVAPAYRIAVQGITHASFSDMVLLDKHFLWNDPPAGNDACVLDFFESNGAQCMTNEDVIRMIAGDLEPDRALEISASYTRAFFDRHLKEIDSDILHGPSADYPDVTFETKSPQ